MENSEFNVNSENLPFSHRMTLHQIWEDLDKRYRKVEPKEENNNAQLEQKLMEIK